MTTCPVVVKNVAGFCVASPVTQTALVLVNAASSHEQVCPGTVHSGIFSNNMPPTMMHKNDTIRTSPGWNARAVKRV